MWSNTTQMLALFTFSCFSPLLWAVLPSHVLYLALLCIVMNHLLHQKKQFDSELELEIFRIGRGSSWEYSFSNILKTTIHGQKYIFHDGLVFSLSFFLPLPLSLPQKEPKWRSVKIRLYPLCGVYSDNFPFRGPLMYQDPQFEKRSSGVYPLVILETGSWSCSSALICSWYRADWLAECTGRLAHSRLPKRKLAEEQTDNRVHRFAYTGVLILRWNLFYKNLLIPSDFSTISDTSQMWQKPTVNS